MMRLFRRLKYSWISATSLFFSVTTFHTYENLSTALQNQRFYGWVVHRKKNLSKKNVKCCSVECFFVVVAPKFPLSFQNARVSMKCLRFQIVLFHNCLQWTLNRSTFVDNQTSSWHLFKRFSFVCIYILIIIPFTYVYIPKFWVENMRSSRCGSQIG